MPLPDRPRSRWIVGAAIETIVWSMKVIATAKIIAVRIRLFDLPPVPVVVMALILSPELAGDLVSGVRLTWTRRWKKEAARSGTLRPGRITSTTANSTRAALRQDGPAMGRD